MKVGKFSMSGAVSAAAVLLVLSINPAAAQYGAKDGQWPSYAGDWGSTKYSALDQINAENVKNLEVKWTWAATTAANGDAPVREMQATPIYVDGYLLTGDGNDEAISLNPKTGETIWRFGAPETGGSTGRGRSTGRGISYWKVDGKGRVYLATSRGWLYCIDAETGKLIEDFGTGGKVDLKLGLDREGVRSYGTISPPVISRDTVVVGCAVGDGAGTTNVPGHVRGYDAKTGKQKWIFHTIPHPGEVGYETWPPEAWKTVGNTNVWAPMTADQELGYVYLPVTTPSNDWYGAHRVGDDLFAESLVCLDAETGKRVWHFQAVHHGLWDYDFPCAPNLIDITVDGVKIKAVAQVSKQGFCYVFDRVTGRPVWPIEEKPVTQSTVPAEKTAATQPHPTKPPAFERQGVTEDMLIDWTPELRAEALAILKTYTYGPIFTPPTLVTPTNRGTVSMPGWSGGANWTGAAVDPETGFLYVPSVFDPIIIGVAPVGGPRRGGPAPAADALEGSNVDGGSADGARAVDARAAAAAAPAAIPNHSRTTGGPATIDGLPIFKPPYGQITAYDLNKGEIAWQVVKGDGRDSIRNHPRLEGKDIGRIGADAKSAPLLTKTLLFVGDGGGLSGVSAGAGGPMLRAYDKKTGAIVFSFEMPGNTVGAPMTYMHEGRQYILESIGTQRTMTGTLCAIGLP